MYIYIYTVTLLNDTVIAIHFIWSAPTPYVLYLILSGELSKAIRNQTDLHYGVYHSLFEWFNPLFLRDKANNFTTSDFVTVSDD